MAPRLRDAPGLTDPGPDTFWRIEIPDPETARRLAITILAVPAQELLPSRINRLAQEAEPLYRPGVSLGAPLPGATPLCWWLWWIAAPRRTILEVHIEALVAYRNRHGRHVFLDPGT